MTINYSKLNIRKLTPKDEEFCIISGYAYYPRAVIAVNDNCPREYKSMIMTAMSKGWITAEAYVKDSEYMWEQLTK